MWRRLAAVVPLLALTGGTPAAQDAAVRSAIELVRLDFLALSPSGQPVTDLSASDVVLEIDGRQREVRSLQFVRLDTATPGAAAHSPPPVAPFGTNTLDDLGRTVLLVIETDSIRANVAQQAMTAAAEFVRGLSPRDWVSVVTMPYGGVLVEPTRDHARALKVLPTITGQAAQQSTDSDKSCRTRDTLLALAGYLDGVAHIEGPKTTVFVSSGMLLPRRDAAMNRAPGPCEIRSENYEQVGRAAVRSRANVYVVRPDDFIIDSGKNAFVDPTASRFRSSNEELAGIESLAGVTSGQLMRLTPTDRSAFAKIAAESSGYYLLGFEPKDTERNATYRRVAVHVRREAGGPIQVRTHPTMFIATAEGKPALTPHAMLRDGRSYRELPLRVVAVTSPEPDDVKLRVVAMLEPLDRGVAIGAAAFGLIDQRGRLVAQWTATDGELKSSPIASAGLASPGQYRLRATAIDTAGRRGAAEYSVTAERVAAGSLAMSGLVLGVTMPQGFVPRLQFGKEPTAAGHFEIVGTPPAGTLSVAMEIARTDDGPALVRVPGTVAATADAATRRATGVVPLANLAAGDYVVRAILNLDGEPVGRISRTLRKR